MEILTLWTVIEDKQLSQADGEELARHEAVIERGLDTFVEVGAALLAIRDGRLYRAQYGTFEDYCRERWNFTRMRASQLIAAAEVIQNVNNCLQIPMTESQARPLASLPPEIQREAWERAVETAPNGRITAAHVQSVVDEIKGKTRPENIHISDDSYEWYTPLDYIEAARAVMGGIDLDPATSIEAQKEIGADYFYTKEDDGLQNNWFGRVWLNPPYCMPDIEQFTEKAIEAYSMGEISQAIILTNNATDTSWFHHLLVVSGIMCLTKGRVKYWGPNASAARQGQAIFYLGKNQDYFIEKFQQFGTLVKLV